MVRRSRASAAEAPASPTRAPEPLEGPYLTRLVGVDADRRPLVAWGPDEAPHVARVGCPLSLDRARLALATGTPALCWADDQGEPILVGLVETECSASALTSPAEPDRVGIAPPSNEADWGLDADVDGRRVRIAAKDEIVLRCGEASITLRRNGKVVVRGTHVETYSSGTNRIKGGQVKIN